MKIFLTSDIHTEHVQKNFNPRLDYPWLRFNVPDDTDVIVLAGDIGNQTDGLEWAAHHFKGKPIIYVAGNHEYYDADISILPDLRAKARALGIHFLENESVIINGVRFLGCTLWTDFNQYCPTDIAIAWESMNDYQYIKAEPWWQNPQNKQKALSLMNLDSQFGFAPDMFSPTVAYLFHQASLQWLGHELVKPHAGKTVVVSHHAPTLHLTDDYAYASNLEAFITDHAPHIDIWMHGHIHQPEDIELAGVRIVSNPRGYPKFGISEHFSETKLLLVD